VLRRASQALERDPQVTAAMVRALGSADPDAGVARRDVDETLRAIIADAIDGETIGNLDDIVRVLGYVWWAVLTTWVSDSSDIDMGEELARAARLLLDGR
jgi:hypothetical protein